ncbi:hypothetical protein BS17DRAFT_214267 [Gyrodon lividus]|nr:hypothetical protein BS17DRAFT_214267 [Gyrodon lividus]
MVQRLVAELNFARSMSQVTDQACPVSLEPRLMPRILSHRALRCSRLLLVRGNMNPLIQIESLHDASRVFRAVSLHDRLELLRDAAAGLGYSHSCSVVPGRTQLSDFGLSSIVVEFQGTSHLSSSVNGITRWAAPEILTMQDDESSVWVPTEQSDIYLFGSIILLVLLGEVPRGPQTRWMYKFCLLSLKA